jgi:copper transport protein
MRPRATLLALLSAVAVALVTAPPALAHAELTGSEPARGAVAPHQPERVTLRFSEPVEATFGDVRVFDAAGSRVDDGDVEHPGGAGEVLAVGLRPDLPDGTYTATYRIISADSHPVSGGFTFSIGARGPPPAQQVDQLIHGGGHDGAVQTAAGVVRWVAYAAIAVGLGALAFLALVWRPALAAVGGTGEAWASAARRFDRRARTILLAAAAAGILSGVAGIVLQGAIAADIPLGDALTPHVVGEVLDTRFGTVWGARTLAWVALGALVLAAPALPRRALAAAAVPAAVIAVTPALGGHAGATSPEALLVPLDVVHVLAMALWGGGLAMILLAVPAATRRLDPPDRSRVLAAALVRFSPLALASVAALLVTGIAQSLIYLDAVGDLTGTAFGRAILAKAVLLAALIGLGALNRQRGVPRLRAIAADGAPPGAVGRLLRRTLRAEVALIVAVLAVTAALVHFSPPGEAASGPFSADVAIGDARLELTVDPALVGSNEIHLYLFRAADGAQYTATKELRVAASLPERDVGPIEVEARRAGPGHWLVPGAVLGVAGTWRIEITNRVSDFDESVAAVEVPVR